MLENIPPTDFKITSNHNSSIIPLMHEFAEPDIAPFEKTKHMEDEPETGIGQTFLFKIQVKYLVGISLDLL